MDFSTALMNYMSTANKAQANVKKAEGTKETEQVQQRPSFGSMTNPRINLESSPESDSVNFKGQDEDTKKLIKSTLKATSMMYIAGLAAGMCPGLFMVAAGAFLLSGKGKSFKDELINAMTESAQMMNKLQQQQNAQNQQQAGNAENASAANNTQQVQANQSAQNTQAVQQTQATPEQASAKVENKNATNPIQKAENKKEQKPLTPLEAAQQKYAKAMDNEDKSAADLLRKEKAQELAVKKFEEAQAILEKTKAEYDEANAELKTQMTGKMTKCQERVVKCYSNANVASKKAEVARAAYEQAQLNTQLAKKAFDDLNAEDIVNI